MGPSPPSHRKAGKSARGTFSLYSGSGSASECGEFPTTGRGFRSWVAKKKNRESNKVIDVKEV